MSVVAEREWAQDVPGLTKTSKWNFDTALSFILIISCAPATLRDANAAA
jgi:hypothetical protein